MPYPRLPLPALLSLSLVPLAGCDKGAGETASAEDCRDVSERLARLELEIAIRKPPKSGGEALPTLRVELPAAPDFESAKAPIKWEGDPDDAYSIYGLRKDIDDRLREGESGQMIVVKGWVQELYVPPVCAEGELCPPAKQPHFWITDNAGEQGKKRAMLVVNYDFPIPEWDVDTQKLWKEQPAVAVEVGKQYSFKGKFRRFSNSGFAHDQGLLEFHSYKVKKTGPRAKGEMIWIYPPNSDWHPMAIAAQEAKNAELRARQQKRR